MSSKKKSSKKTMLSQSSSDNPSTDEEVVPKEESEVPKDANEEHWVALHSSMTPPDEAFYPKRPTVKLDPSLPSKTIPSYLKILWEFCEVLDEVVFRIPVQGECTEDSPEGFFTCYVAPNQIM
ncbi:hypothetical protein Bca101_026350 [Brassica carinata]